MFKKIYSTLDSTLKYVTVCLDAWVKMESESGSCEADFHKCADECLDYLLMETLSSDAYVQASTASVLREMLRLACDQRFHLEGNMADDRKLSELSILITIAGKYFGQLETE